MRARVPIDRVSLRASPLGRAYVIARREATGEIGTVAGADLAGLVASSGGSGTSVFLRFIADRTTANDPDDNDGLKHAPRPPKLKNPNTKVLFFFGDPVDATISLYRRGYADIQSIKLRSWGLRFPGTIEDYAGNGKDLLGLTRHFANWSSRGSRDYDVMFVRYETAWDHLGEILGYVGLSRRAADEFPLKEPRASNQEMLSSEALAALYGIYAPLMRELDQLDDIQIR